MNAKPSSVSAGEARPSGNANGAAKIPQLRDRQCQWERVGDQVFGRSPEADEVTHRPLPAVPDLPVAHWVLSDCVGRFADTVTAETVASELIEL